MRRDVDTVPEMEATKGWESDETGANLDEGISTLLRLDAPGPAQARPAFRRITRQRFVRAFSSVRAPHDKQVALVCGGRPWRSLRRSFGFIAIAALFAGLLVGPWSAPEPEEGVPASISLKDLVDHNRRAWDRVDRLSGRFELPEQGLVSEWIERGHPEGLRFRRQGERSSPAGLAPRIDVSDGRWRWQIDGHDGSVLGRWSLSTASRENALPDEGLVCAALVLPPDVVNAGTEPHPALLNGRPAYRLKHPLRASSHETYWVDAADWLVLQIDDAAGKPRWVRLELFVNPPLDDRMFRPIVLSQGGQAGPRGSRNSNPSIPASSTGALNLWAISWGAAGPT